MSVYVVGDIQGCFKPLKKLLEEVDFCPSRDKLISLGDMINRGPKSLKVLRFCMGLGSSFDAVLGNHDLHLFVLRHKVISPRSGDTLSSVLKAKDRNDILSWLQQKPLVIHEQGCLLVHAGIHPSWDRETALSLSREASECFIDGSKRFVKHLYGDLPRRWRPKLEGMDRIRCIVNICTRMRFLKKKNQALNLRYKGGVNNCKKSLQPWFKVPRASKEPIIFGHWAALDGETHCENMHALDTGCVWGGKLTLLDLQTFERISISK